MSFLGEFCSCGTDDQSAFINSMDQVKSRILCALRMGFIDVMEYFIKTDQLTGSSLDEQNRNILFHALPAENIKMIEFLLKSNLPDLDINHLAQSGNGLLHLCVNLQRIDIMELLMKHYPSVNKDQRNKQDATPLHLAVIYNDIKMIRYLIESGANPNLAMKDKTCLQISVEFSHEKLIELFSKPF